MASLAQIEANRRNAKRSTGPRTIAGKATVARNGISHGLASTRFALLPWEDPVEWEELLSGLTSEHRPSTPTEEFLVMEMARAQWKLNRLAHIEHELIAGEKGASSWSELAQNWRRDCTYNQELAKLERYENSLRRAWYRALATLTKLRKPSPGLKKPSPQTHKAKPIEEAPEIVCSPASPAGPGEECCSVQLSATTPLPSGDTNSHERRCPAENNAGEVALTMSKPCVEL